MNDNNLKIGPEISRRGFLKGAAIAGVSAVIPAEKVPAAVETGNESAVGGFQADKRPLGHTGLSVTELGFGTAPLGNLFRPLPDETACRPIISMSGRSTRLSTTMIPN